MKNKVKVRDCRKKDVFELQALVQELYVTDAGPHAQIPEVFLTFQALKARPKKGRLLVFERDAQLVGYAIIIFFWSNEFAGDVIDVDEILVTKCARGQGVGTAFFKWLGREYKGQSVGWSLQVKPGNKRAINLYEGVGFNCSSNWHMYRIFEWEKASIRKATSATTGGDERKGAKRLGMKPSVKKPAAATKRASVSRTRASS
jgi:GNAT superfamily N-acetyltransferase